ncbi:Glucan endo-1,3-beta-glucosidase [Paramyrothecium foliicola]|nr:Glucan endo-1,3-beta-glucosidase [Paramyrothecium foliicola]
MRSFAVLSALLGAVMAAPTLVLQSRSSPFTSAHPGSIKNVVVETKNTLNGTVFNEKPVEVPADEVLSKRAIPAQLPMEFVNNFDGGNVNAYLSGLDSDGAIVFLGADGQLIYPSSGGSADPVKIMENIAIPLPPKGETLKITLPITITSARIYFCEGDLTFFMVFTGAGDGLVQPSLSNLEDPSSGLNWGFVELTYTDKLVLYANISYVDFVGMILGMGLTVTDGSPSQLTHGLHGKAVVDICNDLVAQSEIDGFAWSSLCIANEEGTPIRVLSNNEFSAIEQEPFQDYWQPYVDKVWEHYKTNTLVLNTQMEAGDINCRVNGDLLECDGDNRGYAKPTHRDIWGCDSGPFGKLPEDNGIHLAVIPRLCAAFTRSTLLIEGGDRQPSLDSTHYYGVDPTHHYSRIVHKYEVDGKGYSFAYDDVNPDGNENASGTVSSGAVDTLTIYVGSPPDGVGAPQPPTEDPQTPPQDPETPPEEPEIPDETETQNPETGVPPPTEEPQTPPQEPETPPQEPETPPQQPETPPQEPETPPQQPETPQEPETPPPPPQEPETPPTPPVQPPPPPPPPPPPAAGGAQSGACSNEGAWNCIDGATYQRCASGSWSATQPVAPGTTCAVGISNNLNLVVKRTFRA